ncbi:MAG: Copper binding protein plastocyanin/azurin family [Pseudonocardiales bacterium]|jgi:plastocyanin|nr:Copper binding protein plastocyanin/azurin family [Pseudonocardiales bacterium]
MRTLLVLPLALALGAVMAPAADAATTHVVEVVGDEFKPEVLWIKAGDSVKWVFRGPGLARVRKGLTPPQPCRHTSGPDSGLKRPGQTYTLKFRESQRFVYHSTVRDVCRMTGDIHVD